MHKIICFQGKQTQKSTWVHVSIEAMPFPTEFNEIDVISIKKYGVSFDIMVLILS